MKVLAKILEFLISQCTSSTRPPFVVHIPHVHEDTTLFNALSAFKPYVQQNDLDNDEELPAIWVDEWHTSGYIW